MTAVSSATATTAAQETGDGQQLADVFVIFGITGDLAKVMTFNSLYRLEQRGLLNCPIVGVAVSDWSDEDLRSHARADIEACGTEIDDAVCDRLAARMSYVAGDFGDASTYKQVGRAIGDARCPVFYLEIPPFLFGPVIKGLSGAGLTMLHGPSPFRGHSANPSPDATTFSKHGLLDNPTRGRRRRRPRPRARGDCHQRAWGQTSGVNPITRHCPAIDAQPIGSEPTYGLEVPGQGHEPVSACPDRRDELRQSVGV
jgi:hypothetical protein